MAAGNPDGGDIVIIKENQLDEWVRGNAKDAQGVIVELVWRLVAASCPQPKERRFPLAIASVNMVPMEFWM